MNRMDRFEVEGNTQSFTCTDKIRTLDDGIDSHNNEGELCRVQELDQQHVIMNRPFWAQDRAPRCEHLPSLLVRRQDVSGR